MYTNDELKTKFRKFLRAEMDAVFFYLDNIDACNYEKNKEAIDKLVLESVDHQKLIVEGFLELNKGTKGALTDDVKISALKEEIGMKDIYQYVLTRTDNERVQAILKKIIVWEEAHELLAKGLQ